MNLGRSGTEKIAFSNSNKATLEFVISVFVDVRVVTVTLNNTAVSIFQPAFPERMKHKTQELFVHRLNLKGIVKTLNRSCNQNIFTNWKTRASPLPQLTEWLAAFNVTLCFFVVRRLFYGAVRDYLHHFRCRRLKAPSEDRLSLQLVPSFERVKKSYIYSHVKCVGLMYPPPSPPADFRADREEQLRPS